MTPTQRPFLALSLRLAAALVLSSLMALVRLAHDRGAAFGEIMFWRQLPTVFLILGWLAARGEISRLKTERLWIHARRAALGTTGMLFTFGAPLLLPLALSTTLGFTAPVFAVILSAVLLGEKIGPVRWLAVALGFAGVMVIARPGAMIIPLAGGAVGLGAGLLVALVSIQVRDLARTDEPLSIVFWFAAFSAPVLALALPFIATHHTPVMWLLLLGCGVVGCLGQLLLTASLRYGEVASVTVMDYSALAWASLYGWALWGEVPPSTIAFGAPLVITAGVVIAWRERLRRQPPAPVAALTGV